MLQRLFGSSKKEKSAKAKSHVVTADKDGGDAAAGRRPEPPASDEILIATTTTTTAARTSSPTLGPRTHGSPGGSFAQASTRSRSGAGAGAAPSSPLLTSSVSGHGTGSRVGVRNLSLTIHSDPVPAGFRTPAASSHAGSPKRPLGALWAVAHSDAALGSPLHPGSRPRAVAPAVASPGGQSRPILVGGRGGRAGASPHEGNLSRTAPALCSSPLLGASGGRGFGGMTRSRNGSLALHTAGAESGGGGVSYWRLPWTQQKVVMCPYCNRPQHGRQPELMNSHGVFHRGSGAGCEEGGAATFDDIDGDPSSSSSSSSGSSSCSGGGGGRRRSGLSSTVGGYCRCAPSMLLTGDASGEAGMTTSVEQSLQPASPPVFIVETSRTSRVVVPGTIADDATSSDDDEDGDGRQRHVRLSLVSPLISSTLRRNSSMGVSVPPLAADRGAVGAGGGGARPAGPLGSAPTRADARPAPHRGSTSSFTEALSKSVGGEVGAHFVASWIEEQQQHLPLAASAEAVGAEGSGAARPQPSSPLTTAGKRVSVK